MPKGKQKNPKKKKYVQVKTEDQKKKEKTEKQKENDKRYQYFNQNHSFLPNVNDLLSVVENPLYSPFIKTSRTIYSKTNTIVYDIKLSRHKEDDLYFRHPWFVKNIRRGLSLAAPFDPQPPSETLQYNPKQFRILRKGLPKFFDLNLLELGFKQDIKSKSSVLGHFQNLKNRKEHFPLKLFVCEKSNGENFQASYDSELDKFVICSKNVSFLVGNAFEAETLDGIASWNKSENTLLSDESSLRLRFSYAKLMAHVFFKKVSKLSPEGLKKFKELLGKYTMVGEYCGNPDFQHLVKYYEIDLEVFAFVNKFSEEICVSPLKSMQIAQEFGFTHVEVKTIESENLEDLKKQLIEIQNSVFFNKNKNDSEGAVLYVENAKCEVTHLVKLKTMDYRMKRKLREKIRRLVPAENKKEKKAVSLKEIKRKYKKELKSMCKDYEDELAEEIDYYLKFGDFLLPLSLELYEKNIRVVDRYVDFLVIVKPFFEMKFHGIEFNESLAFKLIINAFRDSNILTRLNKLYSNRIMKKEDLLKLKFEFEKTNESSLNLCSPYKLLTLVPMGMIGSGKTFILNEIIEKFSEEKDFWGGSISADKRAKNTIERLRKSKFVDKIREDDHFDVAFDKSFNERRQDFDKGFNDLVWEVENVLRKRKEQEELKIKKNLKKIKTNEIMKQSNENLKIETNISETKDQKTSVFLNEGEDSSADEVEEKASVFKFKRLLYIDKNHPLNNSIKFAFKKYQTFSKNFDMVMIGLIPKRLAEFDVSKWHFFDDKTLFICLHNVMNRTYHETLNTSLVNRFNIFLLFLNLFQRHNKISSTMKHYIEYPMDFDVYKKKHVSAINLPGEEQEELKEADLYERKFTKNDFAEITELLKELVTFKLHNDRSDKIKITGKKLEIRRLFTERLEKLDAYKKIIKLVHSTHIDYKSGAKTFAEKITTDLENICKKPDEELMNWMEERKCFPLYLCLYSSTHRNDICEPLSNTVKAYKTTYPDLYKNCKIFYESDDNNEEKKPKKKKKNKKYRTLVKLKNLHHTPSLHVTLKFFHDYTPEDFMIIKNFRDKIEVDLEITHFIFVKDVILTLIINNNSEYKSAIKKIGCPQQNKVDHITFAVGQKIKPFESNIILDQIIERFEKEGKSIQDVEGVERIDEVSLSVKKKKVSVFVVKLIQEMNVEAVSQRYLKN
jgi:hypothetical protein